MATITEYTGETLDLVQVGLGLEPAILITVKPQEEHGEDVLDDLPLNIDFSLLSINQATILLETIVSTLQGNGYGLTDEEIVLDNDEWEEN